MILKCFPSDQNYDLCVHNFQNRGIKGLLHIRKILRNSGLIQNVLKVKINCSEVDIEIEK